MRMIATLALVYCLTLVACGDDSSPGELCTAPLTECGHTCVDTRYDPENCGTCERTCDASQVCSNGTCSSECGGGTTACGGGCVDTQLDPEHCGGCNNACAPEEVCSAEACRFDCVGSTTNCGGFCVDTRLDPANCGGCAGDPNPGDHVCATGQVCSNSLCQLDCIGGTTRCGNLCVDTDVDPANCGGCANDPNPGDHICAAEEVCSNGSCQLDCVGGTTRCSNLCVDTDVDPANCGGCADDPNPGDHICATEEVCSNGNCQLDCVGGTTRCGNLCVDTDNDPNYCGDCSTQCDTLELCTSGNCCPLGQIFCGGSCVDPMTDLSHCGFCGNGCTGSNLICLAGTCQQILHSCLDILLNGLSVGDGTYTIDPDGAGGEDPFDIFCDMTTDDGGWTLVAALGPLGRGEPIYGGNMTVDETATKPMDRTIPPNNVVWKFSDTVTNLIKDETQTAPGIRYETTSGDKYGRADCVWASMTPLDLSNTPCLDYLETYSAVPTWLTGTCTACGTIGGCPASGIGLSGPGNVCVPGVGNMSFCLLSCGNRTDNHFHRHWCGDGPAGYLWVR